MTPPPVAGVLETSLYVDDVARSVEFYQKLFGFELLFQIERAAGFSIAGVQVLLLFKKRGTLEPIVDEDGTIPAHDGDGHLHMAFSIPAEAMDAWKERLADNDIELTGHNNWKLGGESIYFSDLDGHVIELATPGCWKIY